MKLFLAAAAFFLAVSGIVAAQHPQESAKPAGKSAGAKEAGTDDPVAMASTRVADIENRSLQLNKAIDTAETLVRKMHPGKHRSEKQAREGIREYLIGIQVQGKAISDIERDVKIIAPQLKGSLGKAPDEFLRVAKDYEAQAAAEKFPKHRERYEMLAKDARDSAAYYKNQHADFDAKLQQVLTGIEFTRGTVRLAAAMERHLAIVPSAEKAAFLDRLIGVIETHNQQFNRSVDIWRQYMDMRRGGGATPGQALPPVPLPPAVLPAPTGEKPADPNAVSGVIPSSKALLLVELPPDSTLFIEGVQMKSQSGRRAVITPRLVPGRLYYYEVRAEIVRNGIRLSQTQQVVLRPGQQAYASFRHIETQSALARR